MVDEEAPEPRTGPCQPWCSAAEVVSTVAKQDDLPSDFEVPEDVAAEMAAVASELLYVASGRQFTGLCGPVTVRPISRPTDVDTRFGHRGFPAAYLTTGQAGTAWGLPYSGAINHYGTSRPPEVDLGAYPVRSIESVKIDGELIPSDQYRLENRRTLVRTRPSSNTPQTAVAGWPVSQDLTLPDTEPATFSVTYTYGVAPPRAGWRAAKVLAAQLTLDELGQDSALPERITSMTRQGVSVAVTDVEDLVSKGVMGIWQVDVFVRAWNPSGAKLRPLVWSPDLGRPRRMPAR